MTRTDEILKIYDEHSRRLYNISMRIVCDSFEAEEIMHDSLLEYYRLRDRSSVIDLRKWLTSVCIRKSIDRLRSRHRFRNFLEEYEEIAASEFSSEVEDEDIFTEIERVKTSLASLPDNYRLILSLHLFEGFDYQEISQITGTKENTIRSLCMRGKQKLITLLKNYNGKIGTIYK